MRRSQPGVPAIYWRARIHLMDKGRDAAENLYSRQGRSGPVAAAFLIGPDVPECTWGRRVQWGLRCNSPVSNYWPASSKVSARFSCCRASSTYAEPFNS
jgi:hypothetical protein